MCSENLECESVLIDFVAVKMSLLRRKNNVPNVPFD